MALWVLGALTSCVMVMTEGPQREGQGAVPPLCSLATGLEQVALSAPWSPHLNHAPTVVWVSLWTRRNHWPGVQGGKRACWWCDQWHRTACRWHCLRRCSRKGTGEQWGVGGVVQEEKQKAMGTGAGQARGVREDADGRLSAGCQVSARKALVPALSRKCDTCLIYNKIRTL